MDGLVAKWRAARRLQPVYAAFARTALPNCPAPSEEELAAGTEVELLSRLESWFDAVDAELAAAEFRSLLVRLELSGSENELNALAERFLSKQTRTVSDQEKLEFVLSRYFLLCAPPSFYNRELGDDDVAEVLEPFIGDYAPTAEAGHSEIAALADAVEQCASLRELAEQQVLERARTLKASLGEAFYRVPALVTVTRLNLALHRKLNAVLSADFNALLKGLADLEERGESFVQMDESGERESIARLREAWSQWQIPADVECSSGEILTRLLLVRSAVDDSLLPPMEKRITQLTSSMAEVQQAVEQMRAQLAAMARDMATLARGQQQIVAAIAPRPAAAAPRPVAAPAPVTRNAPAAPPASGGTPSVPANGGATTIPANQSTAASTGTVKLPALHTAASATDASASAPGVPAPAPVNTSVN